MRTPKISNVASVLTPGTRSSARRSIRKFSYAPQSDNDDSDNQDASDSDVSTPPISESESERESAEEVTKAERGNKRKREATDTPATTTSGSGETRQLKRSSRKAPKLEKQKIKLEENGTPKAKVKRQPAKKIKTEDGAVTLDPPPNWEEIWNITAEMRKRVLAPVDTMGCENLAEDHRSPRDQRLQTLIALMLSSQTKDTVTAVAMKNLQKGLSGGFNLEALLAVEPEELNRMIGSVGFHNNKTKYIKATALILKEKFEGEIPDTIEGLISLPGVGPKMAYLTMSSAWGRDEGIGVDVHVHRITNLWKWNKTNTPEQTRAALESWLPRERWHSINHMLVGLGQTICLPVGRKCGECDLNTRKLCPSAVAGSPKKKKVVKKENEVSLEDEPPVKAEEVIVEKDDLSATVQVKSEDIGNVILQGVPDIEDFARS
ncbi:related to DNA repair protein Ntg1 [Ramularia collo-cygni]|uniref:Endonuclease III homolog n=1 Tax=Ramularia collo-cygni TaxID=112498 RepID=A0A2D3UPE3_9PEZI|nr:related to DNA repair protein Ntg1 [Ramularia collo-cygni]CZT17201.1 related to DNA repair protein Ntg1 [Ramularia collo-cygni]